MTERRLLRLLVAVTVWAVVELGDASPRRSAEAVPPNKETRS